eukprot:12847271-Alexandrium_andersonii.AAC.1
MEGLPPRRPRRARSTTCPRAAAKLPQPRCPHARRAPYSCRAASLAGGRRHCPGRELGATEHNGRAMAGASDQ